MTPYKNLGGNSDVATYEYGSDYIIVQFKSLLNYEYTYNSAGSTHVEQMKRLADNGQGLNTYIGKNVRKNYSRKF